MQFPLTASHLPALALRVDSPRPQAGAGGEDVPVSPGPLGWGVSGTSGASLCSAALLEVLVLVGSSGACSRVPATPRMPFFPNSFSTSKNHQKNQQQNQQSSVTTSFWYVGFLFLFKTRVVIYTQLQKRDTHPEEIVLEQFSEPWLQETEGHPPPSFPVSGKLLAHAL